jgi:hypothetical protein
MPEILVAVNKAGMEATGPSIVTRIHSLGPPGSERVPMRTLVVSAGYQAAAARVDLPPGKYLFEAYLPNGDIASTVVTVALAGNDPVLLEAISSPHEWLSWQHLTGDEPTWATPTLRLDHGPVALDLVTGAVPAGELPRALLNVWKGATPTALNWQRLGITPDHSCVDGALASYLFIQGSWQDGDRYYGLVPRPPAGPPLLAVLPVPWPQVDMSGAAPLDVLLDTRDADAAGRQEWPVRVSVVVRDNVMASVLGYLASGDLPAAAQVVETAVDLLYQKGKNPLAAAGGAYVLVRSVTNPRHRPVWEPWLENLRTLFPWLPDGTILDGWAHLNGIGRPPSAKKAALAFVDAVSRGLPFYSAGARLLFEGLTRVEASVAVADRPAGFAGALEFVRRLALRIDVRQPFTVVRLG